MPGQASRLSSVINTARGRRFVDDDFAKAGALRLELSPKPRGHVLNRWVFQTAELVQISVIEHLNDRFHGGADVRVIVNPAGAGVDFAFHGNFDLETMPMHPSAFVALRGLGQRLRSFEGEIFR